MLFFEFLVSLQTLVDCINIYFFIQAISVPTFGAICPLRSSLGINASKSSPSSTARPRPSSRPRWNLSIHNVRLTAGNPIIFSYICRLDICKLKTTAITRIHFPFVEDLVVIGPGELRFLFLLQFLCFLLCCQLHFWTASNYYNVIHKFDK